MPAREDVWLRLGQALPNTYTAEDALQGGLLAGWNIRKTPLCAPTLGPDGLAVYVPVADQFALLRDNPVTHAPEALGVAGSKYHTMQNEELSGLLDALVEESGATYYAAGAVDGGRRVFVTMKLPGRIRVGGVDPVENYIVATTTHDGRSGSTAVMVTPVRVATQTTLNLAFAGQSNLFRVRHTTGAARLLQAQAQGALDFTFSYLEGFQQQAEQLAATPFGRAKYEQLISKVFGSPGAAALATQTRAQNKLDELTELYGRDRVLPGTAWAALNAITEWYDHLAPVRPDGSTEAHARSRKAAFRPELKEEALQLILAAV